MADPLSSLIRPDAGPLLPVFERFAPPPPDNIAGEAPGDSAARPRRLAGVGPPPPDLRHFDAGLATLATLPRGEGEFRRVLDAMFASRCPTCGRPVIVDAFIWGGGA